MISDVPEIQAAALTTPGGIMDPELIRWTPGMIRYYSTLTLPQSYEMNWLNGYIHYPINRIVTRNTMVIVDYLEGYITREMRKYPDPFIELPDLNQFIDEYIGEKSMAMYIASGYFPPSIFSTENVTRHILETAFGFIQPKFVRKFIGSVKIDISRIFVVLQRHISYSLIDRAEEMLPLAESIFPPDSEYVLSLRALTGRRIDPNLLPEMVDQWENTRHTSLLEGRTTALSLMVIVAHPQLPRNISLQQDIFQTDIYSSVYYDLAHYFDVIAGDEIDSDREKIIRLYAMGKFWDTYSSRVDELLYIIDTMNLGDVFEKPDFQDRYRAILRQIRG